MWVGVSDPALEDSIHLLTNQYYIHSLLDGHTPLPSDTPIHTDIEVTL